MRRSTLSGLFGFFALLLALTADLSAAYQEPPFKLETAGFPSMRRSSSGTPNKRAGTSRKGSTSSSTGSTRAKI